MNRKHIGAVICSAVLLASVGFLWNAAQAQVATTTASSTDPLDLQSQIDAKNKQLSQINEQLRETQASLQATQQQKTTLQNQLKILDTNVQSLNLNIQADTLTAQQLQLEVQQLGGDISAISQSIADKQVAVQNLLQQLQKDDASQGNLLMVFLKNQTLADTVFETQNLTTLQEQLASDINNLKDLHDQYDNKIQESSIKKAAVLTEQQNLQSQVSIVQDQQSEKQALLASTKGQESVYQQQVSALQKQQQSIANDIESLDALLRSKVDPKTLPSAIAGILLVPIQGDTVNSITQGYGATDFAKNGYAGHWHNGLDLAASIGTPVLAADDGVISGMGNEDLYCPKGAYGKFITINHPDGLTTLYGHLSRQLVTKGQTVKRGQVIGYSGQTGYALGPHLHFTVFAQSTFSVNQSKSCGPLPVGGDLNPYPYLF